MSPVAAFPDTNIFLHYRSFDEIDWSKALSTEKPLLIIAPVVISELDKHKNLNQQEKLKRRASVAIKKLLEFADGTKYTSGLPYELELQAIEPSVDYEQFHLVRSVPVDRLLASMLAFKDSHPESEVVLVTGDLGVRLKAIRLGLKVIILADSFRIAAEVDPNEQKLKDLEAKLRRLERTFPTLELMFCDGNNHLNAQIKDGTTHSEDEWREKVDGIKAKYPFRNLKPTLDESMPLLSQAFANSILGISKEDVDGFNKKLETYYEEYGEWLNQTWWLEEIKPRTIPINLRLTNVGSAPANNIDVFLHFPDGFLLVDSKDFPPFPDEPHAPEFKTSMQRMLDGIALGPGLSRIASPNFDHVFGNVSSPKITPSNSYDVHVSVNNLKHNNSENLAGMLVIFRREEKPCGFSIKYRINAANYPDEFKGELHVIVN